MLLSFVLQLLKEQLQIFTKKWQEKLTQVSKVIFFGRLNKKITAKQSKMYLFLVEK